MTKNEFTEIRRKGKKAISSIGIAYIMPSAETKVGIITSKKLGSAVKRNKIKRRLKEAIKGMIRELKTTSILLIPNNIVGRLKFIDLVGKTEQLIKLAVECG